ncbi:hypothetical protein DIPPA_00185 [Diplonema papillatum]|nr:hypothetical protein DIPPA_00185 [Diplonema papillatum]
MKGAMNSTLSVFPFDLTAEVVSYLGSDDLLQAELSCRYVRHVIRFRSMWKEQYHHKCRKEDWRVPPTAPSSWKHFYHLCRKQRELVVKTKIPSSSATVHWRVSLPVTADSFRQRSNEFAFSNDALGDPIRWQIEVELERGQFQPTEPASGSVLLLPATEIEALAPRRETPCPLTPTHHKQTGLIRMWTTNQWTNDATQHYYGSHCTISIKNAFGTYDLQSEVPVDIDSSAALEFDAACLETCRELSIKVNLTLALEVPAPLDQFYRLVSRDNRQDSDTVKIGYCRAIFEVARCKRKYGGMFVRKGDREVHALVQLAADDSTGLSLRVEVFQALFNLLGPTSILLDETVVTDLLHACFRCLKTVPVPCLFTNPNDMQTIRLLAQNALGTVFNLLVHPKCSYSSTPANLFSVAKLLSDSTYRICHFSVITVLLTVLSWGKLPVNMIEPLTKATLSFMLANDPLDSDCTGVAWDESDVAGFFIPLLRARDLICVKFATWCIAKYYFPHVPTAIQ